MDTFDIEDDAKEALCEALISLSNSLQIFGCETAGYGVHADLSISETHQRLRMHPFCWCDGMECAWCAGHLDSEEGYSNHEILRLEPLFEAQGFVPGEGAPNFQLDDDVFPVRIWWYKYIGRGMRADRPITAEDAAALKERAEQILAARKADIYRASIDAEINAEVTKMDETTCATLRDSFLALLMSSPNGDRHALAVKQVQNAVLHLRNTTYEAQQARTSGDILDAAKVARFENPEDPEEYRLEFSLTHRLESVLGGQEPQGERTLF